MTHNLGMAPYRMSGPAICPQDFKPPSESSQLTSSPSNPKKRRKTSNTSNQLPNQPPRSPQDLLPPPLSGYGDTIVASNPFDDTPANPTAVHPSIGHIGLHGAVMSSHIHHHIGGPTLRGMSPLSIGNISPLNNLSPLGTANIQCGGVMSHINSRGTGMSPMSGLPSAIGNLGGNMSPMGNLGGGISPMGPISGISPMAVAPNSHMAINPSLGPNGNRSVGSPISGAAGSSPLMGSPMGNTLGSPLGAVASHINNGQMGPPVHSPHNHIAGSRIVVPNGVLAGTNAPHHMNSLVSGGPPSTMNSTTQVNSSVNMNAITSSVGGHSSLNHQNVLMSQGGSMGSSSGGSHGHNQIASNVTHQMTIGNVAPNNIPHMSHISGGGPSPINGLQSNTANMFVQKPILVSAGKVYPPGQPMVFNPQNPNAPPIYPCGLCHKEVNDNDEALFCESGCNFFFHSGLTEAAFQLISKEIYAEWCCDKCLSSKNIPLVKFKC